MGRGAAVCTAALVLASTVLAKDIVSMPESEMMKPGEAELAYIYWDTENVTLPNGEQALKHASVVEFFLGLTDWLEVDVIHVDPQGSLDTPLGDPFDTKTELNLYARVCGETARRPRVVVGATNITGADWLPSHDSTDPDGDRRVSPFVIASKLLRVPRYGPPSWRDPAINLQFGYGVNYHEDHVFGIIQFAFTPTVVAAFQHYRDQPGWLVGWHDPKGWAIDVGALSNDPWVHVRYDFKLTSLHF
ncbi:MAG: hypothetical protein H5T86_10565 [Armatimonadetes bacterium]|nr:hypothetical protein [Armatimonadota bacterium]